MSIRIGRKIGKYYVSTGKSGTRVSTKIGDYYVSSFRSHKSKKQESQEIGCVATDDENIATTKMIWLDLGLTFVLFALVWVTGAFLVPVASMLVCHAIGAHIIWKNVESEHKWFNWFFPVIGLFITPLAWVWWIVICVVSYMVI